jgi:hypothetical protein
MQQYTLTAQTDATIEQLTTSLSQALPKTRFELYPAKGNHQNKVDGMFALTAPTGLTLKHIQDNLPNKQSKIIAINPTQHDPIKPKKSQQWQFVVRNTPQDIDDEEMKAILKHNGLAYITHVYRITNHHTQKPTSFYKVFTTNPFTLYMALSNRLYDPNRHISYLVVPSKTQPPTPVQCSHCHILGHSSEDCRRKNIIKCSKCSQDGHNAPACTNQPKCIHCKKQHNAWSKQCEKRREAAKSKPAPLLPIPAPLPEDDIPPTVPVTRHELVYILSSVLLTLHPAQRQQAIHAITHSTQSLWGKGTTIQLQGNQLIAFAP